MNKIIEDKLKQLFTKTFKQEISSFVKLPKSGSSREYIRITSKNFSVIGAYNSDLKENNAFIKFSKTLKNNEIRVPQIFAYSPNDFIYLQEDLGETTLFSILNIQNNNNDFNDYHKSLYKKVILQLIYLQTQAGRQIDFSIAYPRKEFDKQSMQWDLNYFKYMFVKITEIQFDEQLLENDFNTLIDFLLTANTEFFLFRDFQSRNIMVKNNEIYFIDYQGGRKGALHYDLASLLYDAKAKIPEKIRTELKNFYKENLNEYVNIDSELFDKYYYGYSLLRIMQAMGAYGYRGLFEGKKHFVQSIPIALNNLKYLLKNNVLDIETPELTRVLNEITKSEKLLKISPNDDKLDVTIKSFSFLRGYPYNKTGNGGGFVFDCRFLDNPGRIDEYKPLCGKDKPVIDFLENIGEVFDFLTNTDKIISTAIDKYIDRKFTNLTIDFGCTGGRHRSVYCAEKTAEKLMKNKNINVIIEHTEVF